MQWSAALSLLLFTVAGCGALTVHQHEVSGAVSVFVTWSSLHPAHVHVGNCSWPFPTLARVITGAPTLSCRLAVSVQDETLLTVNVRGHEALLWLPDHDDCMEITAEGVYLLRALPHSRQTQVYMQLSDSTSFVNLFNCSREDTFLLEAAADQNVWVTGLQTRGRAAEIVHLGSHCAALDVPIHDMPHPLRALVLSESQDRQWVSADGAEGHAWATWTTRRNGYVLDIPHNWLFACSHVSAWYSPNVTMSVQVEFLDGTRDPVQYVTVLRDWAHLKDEEHALRPWHRRTLRETP